MSLWKNEWMIDMLNFVSNEGHYKLPNAYALYHVIPT